MDLFWRNRRLVDALRQRASLKDYSAQREPAFKCVSIMMETAREREKGERRNKERERALLGNVLKKEKRTISN